MSDSEKSTHSSRTRSRSVRSKRSSNCSKRTEYALIEAATRKAELECRTEALRKRQAIERKEYELQQKVIELEQQREMLVMTSELKVEQVKIDILERFDEESGSRSSHESSLQLPQVSQRSAVRQWLSSSENPAQYVKEERDCDTEIKDDVPMRQTTRWYSLYGAPTPRRTEINESHQWSTEPAPVQQTT